MFIVFIMVCFDELYMCVVFEIWCVCCCVGGKCVGRWYGCGSIVFYFIWGEFYV